MVSIAPVLLATLLDVTLPRLPELKTDLGGICSDPVSVCKDPFNCTGTSGRKICTQTVPRGHSCDRIWVKCEPGDECTDDYASSLHTHRRLPTEGQADTPRRLVWRTSQHLREGPQLHGNASDEHELDESLQEARVYR